MGTWGPLVPQPTSRTVTQIRIWATRSLDGQWAVAQLPDYGAGTLTGPDGGSGVAVMKGCEHPEEAMGFNNSFNTQIDDPVS